MSSKASVLLCSLALVMAAGWLGKTAGPADGPLRYEPVADWPRLPAGARLGGVTGIATDSADRVYLFHRGKQPIMVFDADGKFLRSFGDGLVKTAHGLRIDPAGNIWITDIGNHLVTQFDPAGKVLRTLGTKDQAGEAPDRFNRPADVAVAPSGEIYVADGYGNSRVVKFDADGQFVKAWGKRGKGEGEFHLPHAIFLDAARGRLYVGDRENNRVQVFDTEGKFLEQWQQTGAPYGLFLTARGQMLLADGRGSRVKLLDLMGKELAHWGERGTGPGQFTLPHGICMDRRGAIYVTEVNGQRVQKFVARGG